MEPMNSFMFQVILLIINGVFLAMGALRIWILSDLRGRIVRMENIYIKESHYCPKVGQP